MSELSILGGGITGISTAYHGQLSGHICEVFEARSRYGGLVDCFQVDGFTFDYGVHLSFTHNPYVRAIFDKTLYLKHYPEPYNYEKGNWIKHPVQNNLFTLQVEEKLSAIKGFIDRPSLAEDINYGQWLSAQYGEYIAKRFPEKYSRKYWTVEAKNMGTSWLGNRMYRPSLEEVLLGAMTSETPNTYYAKEMRYPKQGGYRSFLKGIAKECNIHLNKRAMQINPFKKIILFSDGSRKNYEKLVSTIPLPELIRTMKEHVPDKIIRAVEELSATSMALVSVGFNCPDVAKYLWFYIYDENIQASRAWSPSLKTVYNMPENCSSMQFEIYYSRHRPLTMSADNLVEHIIQVLETMKIAKKADVAIVDYRTVEYANVIFLRDMETKRDMVRSYLMTLGIYTAGRFGQWDYLWSDQSLLSGKKVIDEVDCCLGQ